MTAFLAPDPIQSTQFIPGGNTPASGGLLFCYQVGSSTKQNTYTDATASTARTNPIVLDSGGNVPGNGEVWIASTAKFVLAPSNDTDPPLSPYWSRDNLPGVNDPSQVQSEWIPSGLIPTFVNGSSFISSGDQTPTFTIGRRLRTLNTAGTLYSTVSSSVFAASTTIGLISDTAGIDSGLSIISYGIINPVNQSIPGYVIPRTANPQSGLGLAFANSPALYVQGLMGLNLIQSGGGTAWVGINTSSVTGTLEVGDSGALASLKVVGLDGSSTSVEIAMVQNIGGLRTYGGFFLVRETNSDLTWTRRVNLSDTEAFRVSNSTGNFGILGNGGSTSAPLGFKLSIGRNSNLDFTEIGFYSATNILVGGIGTDGAVTNDLRIASIGDIHFYPGSVVSSGATPTNEKAKFTAAGNLAMSTDVPFLLSGQSNAAGASTGTLLNSPHAGNPVFWAKINVNTSTLCFPCFQTS